MAEIKEIMKSPILFSPSEVAEVIGANAKGFSIPIYQRLYSWSKKEIEKLLQDIFNAFNANSNNDYYLGNLTLNFNERSKCYDIIDGQQRMTTLWLIGLVLMSKNTTAKWKPFLTDGHEALLKFTAREDDNEFLKVLLSKVNEAGLDMDFKRGSKVNLMMLEAIKTINNYLYESIESSLVDAYSNYIHANVKLAAIYLPDSIDLNKYFEDMNNRGIQLEAHHILKARLLENIPIEYQKSYAQVWDAVSQMNQYIEYGFSGTLKDHRKSIFDDNLEKYFAVGSSINGSRASNLKELIQAAKNVPAIDKGNTKKQIEVQDKVTSIINFPEFLLHSLRLFNENDKISVDEKKLLIIYSEYFFDENGKAANAAMFIQFLLRARIAFDKYFIKSVTSNEVTRWEIRDIAMKSDGDDFERRKYLDRIITQFQSMLNASTDTSIWLTAALRKTIGTNFNDSTFLSELEEIDRHTYTVIPSLQDLSRGVNTTRYWFYKLDYLLWLKWEKDSSNLPSIQGIDNLKDKVRNFQFRENRSVEHIQPQRPDKETWQVADGEKLSKVKDSFGNLALISTNSNSSYNNQPPKDKRLDFIKRTNNWGIESLKLVSVYSKNEWTIEAMREHEDEMKKVLVDAYNLKLIEPCLA